MNDRIQQDHDDGIDRRGLLKCMAWVGTGLVWSWYRGEPAARAYVQDATDEVSFVQISDSHIGFSKEPNKDVAATLQRAVERINALKQKPAFVLHTGDLTHLAKPEEFDTCAEILKEVKGANVLYVPGEHDVFTDDGKRYLERYGKGTRGSGWYSFDHKGAHFVGLVNVMNLKAGGLGVLGKDQLDWLKKDVEGVKDSTPIIVFAHVPLWTVHEKWGWGTEDGATALGLLKRFGSVTVLNGHIHQILQKTEGKVTFHTARSTAFPQPEPGKADSPGPIKDVAADKLRSVLGITQVRYVANKAPLALTDATLE